MPEPLIEVAYGSGVAPAEGLTVPARLPFDEAVAALKEAIEAEGLWLVHEIDPQSALRKGGYRIHAARQLLFFHPRYMARVLGANPLAAIEAPLRVVVLQMPDMRVMVRCADVEAQFLRYPGLEELGRDLAAVCRRIVDTVA